MSSVVEAVNADSALIFEWCVAVLSLAVLIYGVTSWCLIRKFQHFRNYVYLNAILAIFLRIFTYSVVFSVLMESSFIPRWDIIFTVYKFFLFYLSSVQGYWLLVICYLFYVDVVKVFNGETKRRYLKSAIFSWGVPMLTTLFSIFVLPLVVSHEIISASIRLVIVLLPLLINTIIYIAIVGSLFCSCKGSVGSATSNWRRFYIATLIFLFCDVIFLSAAVLTPLLGLSALAQAVLSDAQVIVLDLFLPLLRGNRKIWREFYMKRMKKNVPM